MNARFRGISEIAAPLLKIDPGASAALDRSAVVRHSAHAAHAVVRRHSPHQTMHIDWLVKRA